MTWAAALRLAPWLLVAGLSLASWALWNRVDVVKTERDDAVQLAKAKAAEIEGLKKSEKVVTRYVDRIKEVPGPSTVRTRLVRVCDGAAALPSASGDPAPSADRDAPDRRDDLARELRAVRLNAEQCRALMEWHQGP